MRLRVVRGHDVCVINVCLAEEMYLFIMLWYKWYLVSTFVKLIFFFMIAELSCFG